MIFGTAAGRYIPAFKNKVMIKELEIKEVEITKKSELKYFMLLQYNKNYGNTSKYFICAQSTDIEEINNQLEWWKSQDGNEESEYKIFSMMLPN